ncbi:4-hydroxythreonine-4-phosphate dehydrogenase PdxA [Agarilytica rhodophyticola]|uniref:4-hydroxythreonine-4-phosphate dehydrogenase PdxA n=1 Tax=Agarilytica rhodophyticola TaxID=1737490 RepID=UPI000B341AD9
MTTTPLLVTPGEPAGIGPELAVKIAQHAIDSPWVAVCDPTLLQERAKQLGLPLAVRICSPNEPIAATAKGAINVLPVELTKPSICGTLSKDNASYVLKSLEVATELCLQKTYSAVVTGPVQKSIINEAGIAFSGHTEFFAERSHTEKVVMMLATEGLRVALATTHLPLRDVSAAITEGSLYQVIDILVRELREKFGLVKPRILVAGLNPHAGENGHLGMEEITTIAPTLKRFDNSQVELIGPLPADTLFTPSYLEKADAVLAMYHDQGLPVLKHKGFGKAVNITLGLPFIRTSVDHGTALDLAGKGIADEGSLLEAMTIAAQLASNRTL